MRILTEDELRIVELSGADGHCGSEDACRERSGIRIAEPRASAMPVQAAWSDCMTKLPKAEVMGACGLFV